MSDFTPGPWTSHCGTFEMLAAIRDADGRFIAMPIYPADARLIAAAPDLLAACEYALDLLELRRKCDVSRPAECECPRHTLRAAIAKATGGDA